MTETIWAPGCAEETVDVVHAMYAAALRGNDLDMLWNKARVIIAVTTFNNVSNAENWGLEAEYSNIGPDVYRIRFKQLLILSY